MVALVAGCVFVCFLLLWIVDVFIAGAEFVFPHPRICSTILILGCFSGS